MSQTCWVLKVQNEQEDMLLAPTVFICLLIVVAICINLTNTVCFSVTCHSQLNFVFMSWIEKKKNYGVGRKVNSVDFADIVTIGMPKWAKLLRIVPKTLSSQWERPVAARIQKELLVFGSPYCSCSTSVIIFFKKMHNWNRNRYSHVLYIKEREKMHNYMNIAKLLTGLLKDGFKFFPSFQGWVL